jgi:putative addiction module killer protein
VIEVREYIDAAGKSPFGKWFNGLNAQGAAKVTTALEKVARGNFSNVEPVGGGVSEYKIDWGPGYRIYFGKDGQTLVILVGGGTKKRQSSDIKTAREHWTEYKKRKRQEREIGVVKWH